MNHSGKPLSAGLYFVSTPIGSARDVTLRGLDILASADVIAAEDTRTARKLMDIHGVALEQRQVVAFHDHSGAPVIARLLDAIKAGQSVAYVSEAGTPLVADPGFELGRAAIAEGLPVTSAPGASAVLAALTVSGLPTDRFAFVGFLPNAKSQREAEIAALRDAPFTLIFYESPKRVGDLLTALRYVLGADRQAVVCRELTKKFEEVTRDTLSGLVDAFAGRNVKGEIVVLVGRAGARDVDENDVEVALRDAHEDDARQRCPDRCCGCAGIATPPSISAGAAHGGRGMTGSTGYHAGRVAEDIVAQEYANRAHAIAARRWRGQAGKLI